MNTLVEKMFGIIMFLAIFVPFQLGLYSSYMSAWEFTKVSTEFMQLVKEEGGIEKDGRAWKFYNTQLKDLGYVIQIEDAETSVDFVTLNDAYVANTTVANTRRAANFNFGETARIKMSLNEETAYGWKPDLTNTTNITVYKR